MNYLNCFVAAISALGLLLSALAHFSTFAGVDPSDVSSFVWLLHLGIFPIWIPTILEGKRRSQPRDLFSGAPLWAKTLSGILFVYAIVNFVTVSVITHEGSPSRQTDGTYAITFKGSFVREINEERYHYYQAVQVRGFSGHWMVFYCAAMTASLRPGCTKDEESPDQDAGTG